MAARFRCGGGKCVTLAQQGQLSRGQAPPGSPRLLPSLPPSQRPQEHPWFQAIDFEKLLKREIEMPFKPKVKSETDASNFDAYFTSEAPQVSPTEGGALDPSSDAAFKNFDTVKK